MEWINSLFERNEDLDSLQMGLRAVIAFFAALILIRVAGQRTFGKKSPVDNVIVITLGAVLSRGVVGASAFIPVLIACTVLALIHRLLAWLAWKHDSIGRLIKGEAMLLFTNGKDNMPNMKSTMISKKDMMEGVRLMINEDDTENVKEIFIERDGEISVIRK